MPAIRRHPHDHDDGPTLLFERQIPAARCPICPYRHVLESMSQETSAIPRHGILPLPSPPPLAAITPTSRPAPPAPSALPRPALLSEPRGSGTLILPDALKPGGPEADTVARPLAAADTPQSPSKSAPFDELASPDITVLQIPVAPVTRARPRHKPKAPDPRAFFALNLSLGLLIVIGVLALAARALRPAQPPATHEARATP